MNVESLALGVHGVETPDEVLEEELEGLGEAEHRLAVDRERGDLFPVKIDDFAGVGHRIVWGYHAVGLVVPRTRIVHLGNGARHEVVIGSRERAGVEVREESPLG